MQNNISVIIPVFNAEKFVTKAVESALMQSEVAEVILIEDGSNDNSFTVCTSLENNNEKVKLFTHPNHSNKGAGASRNLGIKNAISDFIAFLDADDYFLPDRFEAERTIFKNNGNVDGVYGALGFHYYSMEGKKKFNEAGYRELSTLNGKVSPEELFFALMYLHPKVNGQFTIDTLTLKRDVFFGKTEMFNDHVFHEDTAFFIQLSLNCRIEAGIIDKPIGMRGVHDFNRTVNNPKTNGSIIRFWDYLYRWSLYSEKGKYFSKLFQAFLMQEKLLLSGRLTGLVKLLWYMLRNRLFLSKAIFFRTAFLHVMNKNIAWYCINFKEQIQQKFFNSDPSLTVFDEMVDRIQIPTVKLETPSCKIN